MAGARRPAWAVVAACVLLLLDSSRLGLSVQAQQDGAAQQGPQAGEADAAASPELKLWANAFQQAVGHIRGVSWRVNWADLGLGSGAAFARAENPALAGRQQHMALYIDCIDSKYEGTTAADRMSWEEAMANTETKGVLKVAATWWSNHLLPASLTTAVTSSSMNRLQQLYSQCKTWAGPLSVVMYQALYPLSEQDTDDGKQLSPGNQAILRTAVLQVAQFMSDMQQVPGTCRPDVTLIWEMHKNLASTKILYPMNIPRNLARLQARTPLIMEIDIDLVISRSLSHRLIDRTRAAPLLEEARDKTVFVIPAFDIHRAVERAAWADALASSDKDMMVYAFKRGLAFQFDVQGYPQGHNISNYAHWLVAREDYSVKWGHMAEPWFVAARTVVPWHDMRYRGYGKDKVQYVEDVGSRGYKFKVLYNTFCIHRAHKKSEATLMYLKELRQNATGVNFFTHFNQLFNYQCSLHQSGTPYFAPVHPATRACMSVLPWWRGAESTAHYVAGMSVPPAPETQPGILEAWGNPATAPAPAPVAAEQVVTPGAVVQGAEVVPGAVTPGAEVQGTVPQGVVTPGTVTPQGSEVPGTVVPGAVTPGIGVPGTVVPGTVPAMVVPGAVTPGVIPQGVVNPGEGTPGEVVPGGASQQVAVGPAVQPQAVAEGQPGLQVVAGQQPGVQQPQVPLFQAQPQAATTWLGTQPAGTAPLLQQ